MGGSASSMSLPSFQLWMDTVPVVQPQPFHDVAGAALAMGAWPGWEKGVRTCQHGHRWTPTRIPYTRLPPTVSRSVQLITELVSAAIPRPRVLRCLRDVDRRFDRPVEIPYPHFPILAA